MTLGPRPAVPPDGALQVDHVSIDMLHPHVTPEVRAIVNISNAFGGHHPERHGSAFYRNLVAEAARPGARDSVIHLQRQLQAYYEDPNRARRSRTQIGLTIFQTGENPIDDPFAIDNLPQDIQRAFRFKLFGLLGVQLLYVSVLTSVFTYPPFFKEELWPWLRQDYAPVVLFGATVVGLFLLHVVKYTYPLNYAIFALFSTCQAVFFASIGVQFDTYAGCVTCYVSFLVVVLLLLFSTAKTGSLFQRHERSALMPIGVAGGLAFLVASVPLAVVYGLLQDEVLTPLGFILVLAFVLVCTIWFAYDVTCMCKRLSPDEYMQGTVFFYTDMLVFFVVVVTIVAMMTTATATTGLFGSCRCLFDRNDPTPGAPPVDTRVDAPGNGQSRVEPTTASPPR